MSEETGAEHAPQTADQRRDAFVERFAGSVVGAQEVLSIYIGDRLGLYQALADGSALAAPELADAAGIHGRYAREWLEQQAVCGILDVEDAHAEPNSRTAARGDHVAHRAHLLGRVRVSVVLIPRSRSGMLLSS